MTITLSIPDEDIRCFLRAIPEGGSGIKKLQSPSLPFTPNIEDKLICKLPLLNRTKYVLKCHGIETLKDLLRCSRNAILGLDQVGQKTIRDIDDYLNSHGYRYASLPPMWIYSPCFVFMSDTVNKKEYVGGRCSAREEAEKRNRRLGIY